MAKKQSRQSGIVYSTDHGRMCPGCDQPLDRCVCRQKNVAHAGDGVVRVAKETKGRKGKAVTVVTGLPLDPAGLQSLAKQLKQRCGAGGTVKDGTIEIQGDCRDRVLEALKGQGYRVGDSG